jgi:hypothetical protein
MSEPTLQDLEQIARANGYWHRIAPFHEQVTAIGEVMDAKIRELTQRAEAAEAERESVSSQLWDCMNEREALRAERDALRKGLLDLLAVVHRDGGHHTEAVGTRQSVVDAELAVHALRKDAARLNYLDTVRDPCPHHARRGVFGTEWSIVFTHPATHTPTIREALDAALAVQPTTGDKHE